ncbi:MAG: SiaB family protein kinase [Bacteroidales bacterium]|nr:SiaB family protein kinase [Bacteroidales bacterium]MBN2756866.1 SiaB family protein kinase [Bacteroidales bacterium]
MSNKLSNKENLGFIFKLFKAMQKDNLNYIYRGTFTANITDNILALAESNLVKKDDPRAIKRKVYNVMVEGLQNITKHQADIDLELEENYGVFVLKKENNNYFITTGNLIENENIDQLTFQIEQVNSLSKDELKEYHKKILIDGKISNKGGAGLGLIDMARKSGNKLLYGFEKYNNSYSYFYLHTEIPSIESKKVISTQNSNIIKYINALHKMLNDENVLIIFNSYFNQESLMNLLSIIEKQMVGKLNLKKRIYNTMVEMFQNIIQHGDNYKETPDGKAGLFYISESDDNFILNTGNYINNQNIPILIEKLTYINNLSDEDLDNFYNERLLNFEIDSNKEAGLGMIDIRLKTDDILEYNFLKISDKYSFYTLRAKINKNK